MKLNCHPVVLVIVFIVLYFHFTRGARAGENADGIGAQFCACNMTSNT